MCRNRAGKLTADADKSRPAGAPSAGEPCLDGLEGRFGFGAVRAAGLRQIRTPSAALAAQSLGPDLDEIDGIDALGEIVCDADGKTRLAVLAHADNGHHTGADLLLAVVDQPT